MWQVWQASSVYNTISREPKNTTRKGLLLNPESNSNFFRIVLLNSFVFVVSVPWALRPDVRVRDHVDTQLNFIPFVHIHIILVN